MQEIKFIKSENLKQKPKDISKVVFGTLFSDYMFSMDYEKDKGWINPTIEEYKDIPLSPSNSTLHYGQAIFEGMKAYKTVNGDVTVFRPLDHLNRLNRSARILDIPEIDVEFVKDALFKLVEIEKDWIPTEKGASLYIRPFIFSNDANLGVSVAKRYKFMIILSPVSAYYSAGFAPVKIMVEDKHVRAVIGGLGEAKTPANYAASLHAGVVAHQKGYHQVLWLDGVNRKYIEEVGSMNILFKIGGKIVTPALSGSILDGITRKTVLEIAKSWGYEVEERKISIDELCECYDNGSLEEVFGSGTAAVISPVGELLYKDKKMVINDGKVSDFSLKMFNYITSLQQGTEKDNFGFVAKV
ncbi:MAG: Branched-chain-amino-acid aminotransferase 2 [Alphaproteobacteria bacterium ADurb.Bin438]|nr:MAG: Branched-chain-amino-acid aminotransferase 2 [Alphaproteobacteria bacterium ADurb.Bin438]